MQTETKRMFHRLTLSEAEVKLDDFNVLGVQSYVLEYEANQFPTITLKLYIEKDFRSLCQSAGDDADGDLREDV